MRQRARFAATWRLRPWFNLLIRIRAGDVFRRCFHALAPPHQSRVPAKTLKATSSQSPLLLSNESFKEPYLGPSPFCSALGSRTLTPSTPGETPRFTQPAKASRKIFSTAFGQRNTAGFTFRRASCPRRTPTLIYPIATFPVQTVEATRLSTLHI